jgi:hypothetical protein
MNGGGAGGGCLQGHSWGTGWGGMRGTNVHLVRVTAKAIAAGALSGACCANVPRLAHRVR